MDDHRHLFAIVHAPGPSARPITLHSAVPADAATVAFETALERLRGAGATGDLFIYATDTLRIVLRQPVATAGEGEHDVALVLEDHG